MRLARFLASWPPPQFATRVYWSPKLTSVSRTLTEMIACRLEFGVSFAVGASGRSAPFSISSPEIRARISSTGGFTVDGHGRERRLADRDGGAVADAPVHRVVSQIVLAAQRRDPPPARLAAPAGHFRRHLARPGLGGPGVVFLRLG